MLEVVGQGCYTLVSMAIPTAANIQDQASCLCFLCQGFFLFDSPMINHKLIHSLTVSLQVLKSLLLANFVGNKATKHPLTSLSDLIFAQKVMNHRSLTTEFIIIEKSCVNMHKIIIWFWNLYGT